MKVLILKLIIILTAITAANLIHSPVYAVIDREPCGPEGCGGGVGGLFDAFLGLAILGGLWIGWLVLVQVIGKRYQNTHYYKNKVAQEKAAREVRGRAIAESYTYEKAVQIVEEGRRKAKEGNRPAYYYDTDIDQTLEWMNRWRTEYGLPLIVKPKVTK